ncbi:GNAT family N-acetyltransferase [Lederbergia citrea]|uniref:Acetyltransferase n=1 Tax=Lederbergia citrea TaxID=2833581 RepID=A0A942UKB6_9BACI|nr:GNAT family N-acetyltransferase [Lederbergia citrea]MBS4204128.1 acetyltransferase [Lederbergia citrea]MBS4221287.1 acetyltransferase [Lederbergia citrea]
MLFQKGNLKVREIQLKDSALLVKWLSDPKVLTYYEGRDNPFNLHKVNEHFFDDDQQVTRCIVEFDGVSVGYIQFYQVDEETRIVYGYSPNEERIYGMDQFIGEVEYWNRGIGQILVSSMVEYLIKEKRAEKIVMDPQTWNERAIRCYEKCGFEKVKLLPKNEFHEGEYRDCWLIEYYK